MFQALELLLPRGFAYLVDVLIIFLVMRVIPSSMMVRDESTTQFLLCFLYFLITELRFSGSVGKQLVGLRVSDDYGDDADIKQLVLRNIIKIVGIYFYFFTYATIPFFGKALQDLMSGTDVVEDDEDDYDE